MTAVVLFSCPLILMKNELMKICREAILEKIVLSSIHAWHGNSKNRTQCIIGRLRTQR